MPRRRRTIAIASALIGSAALVVTGCGGDADGGASSSSGTSSSSSSTSTSETSSPTDEETADPYAISCHRVAHKTVAAWTRDAKPSSGEDEPARVEATEDGCRVVSSDPRGALIVQWRYLDVPDDSADQGLVREVSKNSRAVEITRGLTAVRSESDVDPTRKTRLYVTFDNGRTMYAEATATLDRPRTMSELEDMTAAVVKRYAEQPPLPSTPVPSQTSATSG